MPISGNVHLKIVQSYIFFGLTNLWVQCHASPLHTARSHKTTQKKCSIFCTIFNRINQKTYISPKNRTFFGLTKKRTKIIWYQAVNVRFSVNQFSYIYYLISGSELGVKSLERFRVWNTIWYQIIFVRFLVNQFSYIYYLISGSDLDPKSLGKSFVYL